MSTSPSPSHHPTMNTTTTPPNATASSSTTTLTSPPLLVSSSSSTPIHSTTFRGPPPLARRTGVRITDRPRALLGWTHQTDTPEGLLRGKIWTAVSKHGRLSTLTQATGVRGTLQCFDEPFNRTNKPGEVRMCGVANFSMVRMFHSYWDVGRGSDNGGGDGVGAGPADGGSGVDGGNGNTAAAGGGGPSAVGGDDGANGVAGGSGSANPVYGANGSTNSVTGGNGNAATGSASGSAGSAGDGALATAIATAIATANTTNTGGNQAGGVASATTTNTPKGIPMDLNHQHKQICRRLYLELLRRYGATVGYDWDALEGGHVDQEDENEEEEDKEEVDTAESVQALDDDENRGEGQRRRSVDRIEDEDEDEDSGAGGGVPVLGGYLGLGLHRPYTGRGGTDDDDNNDDGSASLFVGSTLQATSGTGRSETSRAQYRSIFGSRSRTQSPADVPVAPRKRQRSASGRPGGNFGSGLFVDQDGDIGGGQRKKFRNRSGLTAEAELGSASGSREKDTAGCDARVRPDGHHQDRDLNETDDDDDGLFVREVSPAMPALDGILNYVSGQDRGGSQLPSNDLSGDTTTDKVSRVAGVDGHFSPGPNVGWPGRNIIDMTNTAETEDSKDFINLTDRWNVTDGAMIVLDDSEDESEHDPEHHDKQDDCRNYDSDRGHQIADHARGGDGVQLANSHHEALDTLMGIWTADTRVATNSGLRSNLKIEARERHESTSIT